MHAQVLIRHTWACMRTIDDTPTKDALQSDLMSELAAHGMAPADHDGRPGEHDGLSVVVDGGTRVLTVRVEDGPVATLAITTADGHVHPHPGNPFTDAGRAAREVARVAHGSFTGPRRTRDGHALPGDEVLFEVAP